MATIPLRLHRAVETLELAPDHRVLEIGGGSGVSASLICEVLVCGKGHYPGIDRSAFTTQRARTRKALHVYAGRAELRTQTPEDSNLPDGDVRLHPFD